MKLKLLFFLASSFLASCSYNDLSPADPITKDVYVAGSAQNTGGGSPALWKNGSLELLPPYYNISSSAGAISVSSTAVFWKNSGLNVIPTPFQVNSSAGVIAVSGNDVYMGGTLEKWYYTPVTSYYVDSVVYWKNGISTPLASSTKPTGASGIAISGSDVYVTGYLLDDNWNANAVYWKNGVMTTLPNRAITTGLTLSGSDIYISGVTGTGNSYYVAGCYWKNGILTMLETPSGWSSESTAITVSGSDVYISGDMYNYVNGTNTYAAVFWKNGKITQLSDVYSYARATGIAISGSDVYISGSILDASKPPIVWQALYWKNGVATALGEGQANAICVK